MVNRRFAVFLLRFFGFRFKNSAAVFCDFNDICVGILMVTEAEPESVNTELR